VSVEEAADAARANGATLLVAAFSRTGRPIASARQPAPITRGPNAGPRYDMSSRLRLRPGSYEVRVAVEDGGTIGSVYTFVDVPDFLHAPLSLSGPILASGPAAPSAPSGDRSDRLQLVPTARREFARTDAATVSVKVYQGGSDTLRPVKIGARILDAKNHAVIERGGVADQPDAARGQEFHLTLPLATLAPGVYLLRIEAIAGKTSATRELEFTVTDPPVLQRTPSERPPGDPLAKQRIDDDVTRVFFACDEVEPLQCAERRLDAGRAAEPVAGAGLRAQNLHALLDDDRPQDASLRQGQSLPEGLEKGVLFGQQAAERRMEVLEPRPVPARARQVVPGLVGQPLNVVRQVSG
jgi:hypothetical protein